MFSSPSGKWLLNNHFTIENIVQNDNFYPLVTTATIESKYHQFYGLGCISKTAIRIELCRRKDTFCNEKCNTRYKMKQIFATIHAEDLGLQNKTVFHYPVSCKCVKL